MTQRRRIDEMVNSAATKLIEAAKAPPVEESPDTNAESAPESKVISGGQEESPDSPTAASLDPVVPPQQEEDPTEKRLRDKELYAQSKAEEARVAKQERDLAMQQLQLSQYQLQQQLLRQAPLEPEDLTDEQIRQREIDAGVERKLAALGLTSDSLQMVSGMGEWGAFVAAHPEASAHPAYADLISKTLERFPGVRRDRHGFEAAWNHIQDLKAMAASVAGSQGEAASVKPQTNHKSPLSPQRQEALAANAAKLSAAAEVSVPVGAAPKRTVNKNAPQIVQITDMVTNAFDKMKGNA